MLERGHEKGIAFVLSLAPYIAEIGTLEISHITTLPMSTANFLTALLKNRRWIEPGVIEMEVFGGRASMADTTLYKRLREIDRP